MMEEKNNQIGLIKEKKINVIYSDLSIRLINLVYIKRLISECITKRNYLNYNPIEDDEMIISALNICITSLNRRIRSKEKKIKKVS